MENETKCWSFCLLIYLKAQGEVKTQISTEEMGHSERHQA